MSNKNTTINQDEPRYFAKTSNSCSNICTRRVTHVKYPVISHLWFHRGKTKVIVSVCLRQTEHIRGHLRHPYIPLRLTNLRWWEWNIRNDDFNTGETKIRKKKNQKLELPQRRFTIHIHHCYFHWYTYLFNYSLLWQDVCLFLWHSKEWIVGED